MLLLLLLLLLLLGLLDDGFVVWRKILVSVRFLLVRGVGLLRDFGEKLHLQWVPQWLNTKNRLTQGPDCDTVILPLDPVTKDSNKKDAGDFWQAAPFVSMQRHQGKNR